jgi:predicted ATPase
MTIDIQSIREIFSAQRYALTRDTVKLDEYKAPTTGQFLYLYKDRDLSSSVQIVIHPGLDIEPYLAVPGVLCPNPAEFRHGSNMREFPKRKHRGENEISYGRPLEINSLQALRRFLEVFDTLTALYRKALELPPQLTAIELENFKGVGGRVRIELAPITLLFGANSAGKSTILQALQYVREVLERRNANPDRTLYGGEFVDLGGFRNLVHQHDVSRTICIKLELQLNRADLPELSSEAFDERESVDEEVWDLCMLLAETRGRAESVSIELKIGWSSTLQSAVVVGYVVGVNGSVLASIQSQYDGKDARIEINGKNPVFARHRSQQELDLEDPLLEIIEENSSALEKVQVDVAEKAEDEDTNYEYSVWPEITYTLSEAGIEKPGQGFRNWLTKTDGALPALTSFDYVPPREMQSVTAVYLAREFTSFLTTVIIGPGVLIRDQLRKLRYLGPIRNVPSRDFTPALTPDEARWADGTGAWETLLSGSDALVDEVSHWMSDTDKLATGYEVARRRFKEVDVRTITWLVRAADPDAVVQPEESLLRQLDSTPEKARIELIDPDSGDPFLPKDVGIGISQVLPVVVAALEPSAALVAIEQPELHIHPAVQVGLGDLLIKGSKEHGISFLIETHSEHLILRLLRRIREKSEGELQPGSIGIAPEDVAVVYVQSTEAGVELVPLPIDETGEFTTRWPKGFFGERAGELF